MNADISVLTHRSHLWSWSTQIGKTGSKHPGCFCLLKKVAYLQARLIFWLELSRDQETWQFSCIPQRGLSYLARPHRADPETVGSGIRDLRACLAHSCGKHSGFQESSMLATWYKLKGCLFYIWRLGFADTQLTEWPKQKRLTFVLCQGEAKLNIMAPLFHQ